MKRYSDCTLRIFQFIVIIVIGKPILLYYQRLHQLLFMVKSVSASRLNEF